MLTEADVTRLLTRTAGGHFEEELTALLVTYRAQRAEIERLRGQCESWVRQMNEIGEALDEVNVHDDSYARCIWIMAEHRDAAIARAEKAEKRAVRWEEEAHRALACIEDREARALEAGAERLKKAEAEIKRLREETAAPRDALREYSSERDGKTLRLRAELDIERARADRYLAAMRELVESVTAPPQTGTVHEQWARRDRQTEAVDAIRRIVEEAG